MSAIAALLLASVAPLGAPGWAAAQERASPATIELSGDIEASRLVELVSQRLGVSIQYQPRELAQRVTLRLRDPLDDDELWDVLIATLESVGLAVVESERDGVFRVVPVAQAAQQHQRLTLPGEAPADAALRAGYSALIVRLESADPAAVAASVGPLLTPQSGVARPIGDSGLLLLADVRRRVEQALRVIELIDRPRDPVRTFVVDLEQSPASEAAQLAQQILTARIAVEPRAPSGRSASPAGGAAQVLPLPGDRRVLVVAPASRERELRDLLAQLDHRSPLETRSYAAPFVAAADLARSIRTLIETDAAPDAARSRVAVDELTGATLVTAAPAQHARISALVESLVNAPPESRRAMRSFRIRNRDAADLASTLGALLSGGDAGWPADTAAGQAPDGAASPLADRTRAAGGDLHLTVDAPTNTILAVGDRHLLEQAEAMIAELDRRRAQVMIEVTMLSLSEGEARDVGVELSAQFRAGSTDVNLSSLFGLGAGGAGGEGATGTGFTGLVVNPGDFQALVRAVETVSRGRTLSTPKILVNNNATATLRSVNREPFTSVNASTTVATTSFGGTQDAGTTITVSPHIAEGDHLVLDYAIELSAFTGEATRTEGGGVVPPSSQQNSLDGQVTIPDGHTIVLGGIESLVDGLAQTRVPVLGRLPLLGLLFRAQSDSDTRARFYVFIRATILRDAGFEDLRLLSGADMAHSGLDGPGPVLTPVWVE